MTFKDIEVGDIVYIEETVKASLFNHVSFFVPKKVERITKTQFIVNQKRYRKLDGYEVGNNYNKAFKLNESSWGGKTVVDETDKMKECKLRIYKARKIRSIGEKLSKIDHEQSDLDYLFEKCMSIFKEN